MADPIRLEGLTLRYGPRAALDHVDLALPRDAVTVLAGPNGCGKSTLLRAVRRLVTPSSGRVRLDGADVADMPDTALARRIALLAQSPSAPEDLTVFGLVRLGRYPHQTLWRQWSREDARAVEEAMAATGVADLAERPLDTLSGGQRQRVWLAMALAQDAPILCLDEPINHLDLAHQLECLALVRRLVRERGRTVILVLHDLNLAARTADHLVVLREGRVHAQGRPEDLLDETLVREAFGVECVVIRDPVHGSPLVIPIAAHAAAGGSRAAGAGVPFRRRDG